jgi:hypothetical protein
MLGDLPRAESKGLNLSAAAVDSAASADAYAKIETERE